MDKTKSYTSILKNNLFAIGWQFKVAPVYTLYVIVSEIIQKLTVLFEHTFLVAYMIDCLEKQRPFVDILKFLLPVILVVVLNCLRGHWVWCYVAPKSLAKIKKDIHLTLYRKAVSMDITMYDNSEFYNDFVWAMQKAPTHIMAATDTFKTIVAELIVAIVAGAFIVSTDIMALTVVAVILIVTLVLQSLINKYCVQREKETIPHTRKRDYINRVFYLIDYVKDLKMSDMANTLENDFNESSDEIKSIVKQWGSKLTFIESSLSSVGNLIYSGVYLSYLFYSALVKNMFGMGVLMGIYNSTNKLKNSLYTITMKLPEFQEHSMYIEKLRTFLDTENEVIAGTKKVPTSGNLCLEHVRFTYDGNTEPTLKDISMQIKQGEKIALVGFNGAGKSTLIKLMLRLYDPDSGSISYAGEDVRHYKLSEYRKLFGTLFQDFEIFATDVGGNIGMQEGNIDKERADMAIRKAGFWDRFRKMPQGYNTPLTKEFSDDGVNLSGGEAQKLALARVLYADSSIIVLDEPSSALHPIAEYQLNKTITKLSSDKTVVIISHRLSTTRFVDKIYMLENGEIKEQGTHDTLMQLNGAYAEMFRLQAEKYR